MAKTSSRKNNSFAKNKLLILVVIVSTGLILMFKNYNVREVIHAPRNPPSNYETSKRPIPTSPASAPMTPTSVPMTPTSVPTTPTSAPPKQRDSLLFTNNNFLNTGIPLLKLDPATGKIDIPSNITHLKIDIGLYLGAINSANWLKRLKNRVVFAFEADPRAFFLLTNAMMPKEYKKGARWDILHESQVFLRQHIDKTFFPMNVAVGRQTGIMEFSQPKDNIVGGQGSLLKNVKKSDFQITHVPVITLSEFFQYIDFARFKYIEHIKIDAQGMDAQILAGAGDMLGRYVLYVTAEVIGQHKDRIGDYIADGPALTIMTILKEQGFEVFKKEGADQTWRNTAFRDDWVSDCHSSQVSNCWCEYT